MSMDTFMQKFGGHKNPGPAQPKAHFVTGMSVVKSTAPAQQADGFGMSNFMEKFSGLSQPFNFYYVDGKPTVTLRFDKDKHIYYRVMENGALEPQKGVTTVCHIIDKSRALVPWAAKVTCEKMMRLMPIVTGEHGQVLIKQMTLAEFSTMVTESKNAHKERLEEAGAVGNLAHNCLEESIKLAIAMDNGIVRVLINLPQDERAVNCCNSAFSWMKEHNVRWIQTEKKVYSKKYSYAGTMDGLCIVDSCSDPLCCPKPFKDALSVADWKSSNYLYVEYLYQTAAYEKAHEEEHGVEVSDRWILRLGKDEGDFEPWHLKAADSDQDFKAFILCQELMIAHESVEERMRAAKKLKTAARRAAKMAETDKRKEKERLEKAFAKAEKKRLREEAKAAADEAKAKARREKAEKKAAERIEKATARKLEREQKAAAKKLEREIKIAAKKAAKEQAKNVNKSKT